MNGNYLLNRLRNEIAQCGVWGLSQKIWNKIAKFLYYSTSSVWYERNLDEPILHITSDLNVETEFLVHDKIRLVEWLKENKSKYPWIYFEEEVDTALKHNHVYLLMMLQDHIIGYVKIGIGPTYIHDFDQMLIFQQGTAFVYDTFTLPEYRGKSLALFALNQAAEYFKARSFERILCHIESWNLPSIKTFEKAGFRAKESIRFIRTARFSLFIRGGCIPFFNLERYLSRPADDG